MMSTDRFFLTVEWCNDGHRGIFCSSKGNPFSKEGSRHTEAEKIEILGPFWTLLAPHSELMSKKDVAQYTRFRSLGEYTHEYGIAVKEEDDEQD